MIDDWSTERPPPGDRAGRVGRVGVGRLAAHLEIGGATGGRHWGAVVAPLSSALAATLSWTFARRRASTRARAGETGLRAIIDDCEQVSAEVMELVVAAADGTQVRDRWRLLHTRLVDLEHRATNAANATRDSLVQLTLDQLAGGLIALRGALEVDVRLHLDADASATIVAAGDDAVVVRCEDLVTTVRALRGRQA